MRRKSRSALRSIIPLVRLLPAILVPLLLIECANPVSPSGGPKDETPPGFLRAEPPMYTRNFQSRKVRIYFDEFLQFKDVNQQVIISPPMNENPVFKLKGKSVMIEFEEELKDSTTYNIFFGNAIVDLAEANPATNFQYVFSTGDILDSLSFTGRVTDAFTLEPAKDLNVMLYLDNNDTIPLDSLPFLVKPYYYTKTDENGDFRFNNLRDEDFKLFVLEDANSNMVFDQISERIAFLDSLIHPYYITPPTMPDTSLGTDSIVILPPPLPGPEPVQLSLYQERDSIQRFIKASLVKEGKLMFVFKIPTTDPRIRALNMNDSTDWMMLEKNLAGDTINMWFTKDVPDTLTFVVADQEEIFDTLDISTVVKARGRRDRDKQKEGDQNKLIVKVSKKTELNTSQKVHFNYPIRSFDLSGSMMIENEDTLVPVFNPVDSIGLSGEFKHEWLENSSYSFLIPDSVFIGLGGQSHDTLKFRMKTKALADYGNLILNVSVADSGLNHIIQLIKDDKLIDERIINQGSELRFNFLLPGDYRLKVIYDKNNNRSWDTGNYEKRRQPERVVFFEKLVTIRANWDIVEDWQL